METVQREPGTVASAPRGASAVSMFRPSWPTHVRVTIGTPEEMKKFQTAFLKVMQEHATGA